MSSYAVPPVGSGFIGHGSPAVSEYNYGTGQYVDRLPAIFGQQNYGEIDAIPYLDELQAQQNLGDSHRWYHKAQQFVEDIPKGIQQIVDDTKAIVAATSSLHRCNVTTSSEASGLESIPQYTALYNECVKAYNESKETYDRWDRETRDFIAEEEAKQSSSKLLLSLEHKLDHLTDHASVGDPHALAQPEFLRFQHRLLVLSETTYLLLLHWVGLHYSLFLGERNELSLSWSTSCVLGRCSRCKLAKLWIFPHEKSS